VNALWTNEHVTMLIVFSFDLRQNFPASPLRLALDQPSSGKGKCLIRGDQSQGQWTWRGCSVVALERAGWGVLGDNPRFEKSMFSKHIFFFCFLSHDTAKTIAEW
jgi:hypothetical protein